MKSRLLKWGIGLILGTFFTACSSDYGQTDAPNELQEIKLTAIVSSSRGADLSEQSTSIIPGQQVGVTIIGGSLPHDHVIWESKENGELVNTGSKAYFSGDSPARIYAYHPYNSTWNDVANQAYIFTVQSDQTGNGYANSDLLWADVTSTKSTPTVKLSFLHLLSKVNVVLQSTDGTDVTKASISLINVEKSVSFQNGSISTLTGDLGVILAGENTSAATVIVAPQALQPQNSFIVVTLNNNTYVYDMFAVTTQLESGGQYNYLLTLNESGIYESGQEEQEEDEEQPGGSGGETGGTTPPTTPTTPPTEDVAGNAVDLGLPSGTLWADRNVGATSATDFGNYYAWGEIQSKSSYTQNNYKYFNKSTGKYTKYTTDDGVTKLVNDDDPSRLEWGGKWRTPTRADFVELLDNCTFTYTTTKVVAKGPNGKTITFPNGGMFEGSSRKYSSKGTTSPYCGYYWTKSVMTAHYSPTLAYSWFARFSYNTSSNAKSASTFGGARFNGYNIRPVRSK